MTEKTRVGILFGGQSPEHEVALQSAKNVVEALDRERYIPVLIGIGRDGRWMHQEDASRFLLNATNPKLIKLNREGALDLALVPGGGTAGGGALTPLTTPVDVVFPIFHGPLGEDGTIQGLLRLMGIPFVGSDVLGSALAIDKDASKRLLEQAGLPVVRRMVKRSFERESLSFRDVKQALGSPVFVKPANLGSSVGVSRAHDEATFLAACNEALRYDYKILIEEAVKGRELEVAVLGNEEPLASEIGEIVPKDGFYSYQAKYVDVDGAKLIYPADVPPEAASQVKELALQAFKTLECWGMARVDFFLKDDSQPIINEVNTIPGFTRISMYPKLWEISGVPYPELIHRLIQLALDRQRTFVPKLAPEKQ